ncbi:MAG: CapA family protein [Bacteroidota bacterium]
MRLIFLGDIALNGDYIDLINNSVNPFANLIDELSNADFVVGNLECLLSGSDGENLYKKPRLYTTREALKYLLSIQLNVACLANNHIYDHLDDGIDKTLNFLKEHNIYTIGFSYNSKPDVSPLILKKNNVSVALFNFVTKDTNICKPDHTKIAVNVLDIEEATRLIKVYRDQVNFIVFIIHWGGIIEGGLFPDRMQPVIARKLIDGGADLIIGHHSHTIQPYEKYKGKYIFYSLGNFCFSNFFFDNIYHPMPKRRMRTVLLSVDFSCSPQLNNYKFDINYYFNNKSFYSKTPHYKYWHNIHNFIFSYLLRRISIIWYFYFIHLKYVLPLYFFIKRSDLTLYVKLERLYFSLKRRITNKIFHK